MQVLKKINQKKPITYSQVGDNYDTKDPIKRLAQIAARKTCKNLIQHGFTEISDTRGESAFVWRQGRTLMAAVVEGLGTKNLIADSMRSITGKTYYDVIAHDAVATIINDLVSVGAKPLVIHAYWAVENNDWLKDETRMQDFINGWRQACDLAGATWGGGETPTLKGIINKNTIDVAGSAVGIVSSKKNFVTDKKLKHGDRILLCKSNGVDTNGISLARAIAKKLKQGYATRLPNGQMYGEALLTRTNIYAKLIRDLLDAGIDIHYISNITGHGWRKIMRANREFSYIIDEVPKPQPVFQFIQEQSRNDDREMYGTFNMGAGFAVYVPQTDVEKAQQIGRKHSLSILNAGFIKEGSRRVVIKPKNIIFEEKSLGVR